MRQMITLDAFLCQLDAIAAQEPTYRLGGDGSDGTCDCIGLIIGAIRRSGGSWEGIHGSNYAARNAVQAISPIQHTSELAVGEAVFKAASPGQSGYNLPSRYAAHPDQRDYYHVGVVRSLSPLKILHCTGPGIVTDTKLGKWGFHGWLNLITPEGESTMSTTTATVRAENGSTVNLRSSPNGSLTARLPVGACVTLHEQADGWSRITYNDHSGWMKSEYLATAESSGEVTLRLPQDTAAALRDALIAALGQEG